MTLKEKAKLKELRSELKKFRKAFYILIPYFDSISDEEQEKVGKQLNKLGL